MKARITYYNHIVKITYNDGHSRSCPFTRKKNAYRFAKAMESDICKVEVIAEKGKWGN